MSQTTLSLYRLQQIDSQIDRAQTRMQAIQQTLEDDAALKQAGDQADTAAQNRLSAEQALKLAETEVLNSRIKIEQTESSLYSGTVHNPKELQDLQNDVAALKRYLVTLEDRLLEAMLAQEQAEITGQDCETSFLTAQKNWSEQNQNLYEEQTSLKKELQRLATERAALAGVIPTETSQLYDQLRQQRRGLAVATVSDNSCDACGSTLTAAQIQAARSTGQMERCPSCGRILYGS